MSAVAQPLRTKIDLYSPATAEAGLQVFFNIAREWKLSIAEQLAKEKRYNGATPGVEYSVAEHSVRGCDAILSDTSDGTLAGYFLLHDCAEALLKDDTTPKKHAIAEIAEQQFGVLGEHIIKAFDLLTYRHDAVIHEAAGLPWPPASALQPAIKRYDLIMFVTEWRDLMHSAPHPNWAPYSGIKPLSEEIVPVTWRAAKELFLKRARALLPTLREKAA
jgi:hypothetical protein